MVVEELWSTEQEDRQDQVRKATGNLCWEEVSLIVQ